MSFCSNVKVELCKSTINKKCCALAEAYGVLLYCNTFSEKEVRVVTGNQEFAARLQKLFKRAFSVNFDVLPAQETKGKQIFRIVDQEKIQKIFNTCGY